MEWIDWAKFVAIFLVVLGHLPTPVGRYLFCFHMAFFFLISGFLAKRRPLKEEWKRSAKALLLPYVIYNCFLLIYSYFTKELKPNYPLMMLLGNQWELSMACRPLWFLLSLFLIRIVYALVGEKGSIWAALVCIALVYAGRAAEVLKPQNDWFQVWPAVICFPFFALGAQTRRLGLHKFSDGWKKAGWLLCAGQHLPLRAGQDSVAVLPRRVAAGMEPLHVDIQDAGRALQLRPPRLGGNAADLRAAPGHLHAPGGPLADRLRRPLGCAARRLPCDPRPLRPRLAGPQILPGPPREIGYFRWRARKSRV